MLLVGILKVYHCLRFSKTNGISSRNCCNAPKLQPDAQMLVTPAKTIHILPKSFNPTSSFDILIAKTPASYVLPYTSSKKSPYSRYDGGGVKLGDRCLLGAANLTCGLADVARPSGRP
jgi:hypothetical protein